MKKIIIPKEQLYQKYIMENLSRADCAQFFNVKPTLIKDRIKEYGFVKTKEQTAKLLSKKQKIVLDKSVLYEKYIVQNLSLLECAEELQVSPVVVKRRLRDFGIKKTSEKFKEVHRIHSNQTVSSKLKREKTVLAKYGVSNVSKSGIIKDKKEKTTQKHYGVVNPFQSKDIQNKISNEIMSRYGVPYSCMREECRKYSGNNSKPNREFANKLDGLAIKYEREFALENLSYDFKVKNLLFEIDPTIFHNSTFAPVGKHKDKMYHYTKHCVAKEYGYHCVHVFDWDDQDKIVKVFLEPKEKVYARLCSIREVPVKEARAFLNQNHLQSYAKDTIRLGLYQNDTNELVEIMTFDKPRYNKKYEYELVRLCSVKNVIGGTEKLLNHFVKHYEPKSIISYCDLSKFDGTIYRKLGFTAINKPQPSKHWVSLKTGQHITDNLLRKCGFDQLFKTHYGKGTSNEQLMRENGFVEVYDCGQIAYTKVFTCV